MYQTDDLIEKIILVSVEDDSGSNAPSAEICLDELAELAKTAGAEVVGRLIQKRERQHPAHYLGKGKVDELKALIGETGASGIICDDELSSTQLKNLDAMLNAKVMDRTLLILDIFADHAITAEGKVQVELAQLRYRLSHLTGLGQQLSRLGGGIGTRGPGEKKLETDRRHIRSRIDELSAQLKEIETGRRVLRERREKSGIPVFSLVGYTNSGKSTLLNALTNAEVLAEDKLFATLDTTTRKRELSGGEAFLLTDTVGFIQKLPTGLIKAFRATLEELKFADFYIHVVDASNESRELQMKVVYDTLLELKVLDKPVITVYNKIDKDIKRPLPSDSIAMDSLCISARTGEGVEDLLVKISEFMSSLKKPMKVLIPFTENALVARIRSKCKILNENFTENGTYLEVFADEEYQSKLANYAVDVEIC